MPPAARNKNSVAFLGVKYCNIFSSTRGEHCNSTRSAHTRLLPAQPRTGVRPSSASGTPERSRRQRGTGITGPRPHLQKPSERARGIPVQNVVLRVGEGRHALSASTALRRRASHAATTHLRQSVRRVDRPALSPLDERVPGGGAHRVHVPGGACVARVSREAVRLDVRPDRSGPMMNQRKFGRSSLGPLRSLLPLVVCVSVDPSPLVVCVSVAPSPLVVCVSVDPSHPWAAFASSPS